LAPADGRVVDGAREPSEDAPDAAGLPDVAPPSADLGLDAREVAPDGGEEEVDLGGVDRPGADAYCGSATSPSGQPTDKTVFVSGVSYGPLHGPTWVSAGRDDAVSSPACTARGGVDAGVAGHDCAGRFSWDGTSSLCVTGSVPSVTADVLATGVDWGLAVVVDADGCGGTLGARYSEVSATVVGIPKSALDAGLYHFGLEVRDGKTGKVSLYFAGDGGTGKYQRLDSFTTHWWDDAGDHLSADQVTSIVSFGAYVTSSTSVSTAVSSMCLLDVSWR